MCFFRWMKKHTKDVVHFFVEPPLDVLVETNLEEGPAHCRGCGIMALVRNQELYKFCVRCGQNINFIQPPVDRMVKNKH